MSEISALIVKKLRDQTGAGMMDCKKALLETDGNLDKATDWLRKKGISGAEKKSARTAADGLVGVSLNKNFASLVEVNTETDFVSRNTDFQEFVVSVSEIASKGVNSLEELLSSPYKEEKQNVSEKLTELVGQIGENLVLRRCEVLKNTGNLLFSSYMHSLVKPGIGKIGVIVSYKVEKNDESAALLAKQIAMHIAATRPIALNKETVDEDAVNKEKEIYREQAKSSGKPENIIEKMVIGRIAKFYSEIVLLEQTWVIDGESKVSEVINNFEGEKGYSFELQDFKYFILGEGIEIEEKDFASEVAEQINK